LFDLLISDIRLPDGSGLDLIRRLQSNRPIRGIAISGFGTEQDQRRSREAGYETHLTKPVDFDRLLEAIETLPPRPVG
jgi:CheY-like chemotaxis protein